MVAIADLAMQLVVAPVLMATVLRPFLVGCLDTAAVQWLLRVRNDRRHRHRNTAMASLLKVLPEQRQDATPLVPGPMVRTENDVAVARASYGGRDAFIKVALSDAAAQGLAHHRAILETLHALPDPDGLLAAVPAVLEWGVASTTRYIVETATPGVPISRSDDALAIVRGLQFVHRLHGLSARECQVDEMIVRDWTDPHLDALRNVGALKRFTSVIDELGSTLRSSLVDRTLVVAITHGDCWPGNVLVQHRVDQVDVTGLIDWENGVRVGLPEVDYAHYWLVLHRGGPSTAVKEAVDDPRRPLAALLAPYGVSPRSPDLSTVVVLLLAWLSHVGPGLTRASRFAPGRLWLERDVVPVLTLLERVDLRQVLALPSSTPIRTRR